MRELIELLRDMHASSYETRGVGRHTDTNPERWIAYCEYDKQDWPCETVALLEEHAQTLPESTARLAHPDTMIAGGHTRR
jgi:hypothetical protein